MRIVFVDSRRQVLWGKPYISPGPGTNIIGLTAEAIQALEEEGIPHSPVCAYADTRALARLEREIVVKSWSIAEEIETFVSKRRRTAQPAGSGFLTGHAYVIQFSVQALATRLFLMREAIRACSPESVTAFAGGIDPWFSGAGYVRDPWLDSLEKWSEKLRYHLEIIALEPPRESKRRLNPTRLLRFGGRCMRYASSRASRALSFIAGRVITPSPSSGSRRNMRLLFVGAAPNYDWRPVLESMRETGGAECYCIPHASLDGRWWTTHFAPSIRRLWPDETHELHAAPPIRASEDEIAYLSGLFDEWMINQTGRQRLEILGMDLLGGLALQLRSMTSLSPALVRYCDSIADKALETIKPDAVCFFAVALLCDKRLAHKSRESGIPVISYQHGGGEFAAALVKDELNDFSHVDWFLTYGKGITPPPNPSFKATAELVPVGSAALEAARGKRRETTREPGKIINVLWIGETSSRNTHGLAQVEDTKRFVLQKKCLSELASAPLLETVYRPYPGEIDWNGVSRWIEVSHSKARVDIVTPLRELIQASDVIITDTTSPTTWDEVIACGKPLILYYDVDRMALQTHYAADLEQVCRWVKSEPELALTVERLATDGATFLAELRRIDAQDYRQKYLFEPGVVNRVLAFLGAISSTAPKTVIKQKRLFDPLDQKPFAVDLTGKRCSSCDT
jgi:hypothetical protein